MLKKVQSYGLIHSMNEIKLTNSSGNAKLDKILEGIVEIHEIAFPDRIRGYFLTGSYSDNDAVAASDVDMYLVCKGGKISPEEDVLFDRLRFACQKLCPLELDLHHLDEEFFYTTGHVILKLATVFVYGEDIRDKVPLRSIEAHLRNFMYAASGFIARNRSKSSFLSYPLDYPDPSGEFYGYDQRPIELPSGENVQGIKELVVIAGEIATILLAQKAQQYAASKSQAFRLYQEFIQDEWTELLATINQKCRREWGYYIPIAETDRLLLRDLCRRILALENYYLELHKAFVLNELENPDLKIKTQAVRQLGRIFYPDKTVEIALQKLENIEDENLQKNLQETSTKIKEWQNGRNL